MPFARRSTTLKVKNAMARIVVRLRADRGLFSLAFVIFITSYSVFLAETPACLRGGAVSGNLEVGPVEKVISLVFRYPDLD
jgi:hypothetical protein